MINYEEKLKELRFNFRPEEIIDYETLIALIASLFTDETQYEQNKEELFHTLQILVLVYGLEDQLIASNFQFNQNNIELNNLDLWKYLTVELYNDLERTNNFVISDETKNKVLYVLSILDPSVPQLEENNISYEESAPLKEEEKYHFIEPDFNFNENNNSFSLNNDNDLNSFNWDYLPEYIRRNNILPYHCACCGLDEWQGKPLKLILSKKDKNECQRIENLEFLCPNCYSQIGK